MTVSDDTVALWHSTQEMLKPTTLGALLMCAVWAFEAILVAAEAFPPWQLEQSAFTDPVHEIVAKPPRPFE